MHCGCCYERHENRFVDPRESRPVPFNFKTLTTTTTVTIVPDTKQNLKFSPGTWDDEARCGALLLYEHIRLGVINKLKLLLL